MSNKISEQVATEQLNVLLDYYELEASDIDDKKQLSAFESACSRMVKAIRKGRLEIKEDGVVTQILKKQLGDIQSLEYSELTGRAKMEMSKVSGTDNHGKMYALLGSLSGVGVNGIAKLKGVDLSVAECLGLVFMLV